MLQLVRKSVHPIIVLEGPDGAGKTTLARELQEQLGARYIHLTYRFRDKMHVYHSAALKLAYHLSKTQPVIIDRWWPSEIVYADAYRGGSKFTKYYFLLEHLASEMGLTYIFCLPNDRDRYLKHYNVLKGKRAEMYDEGLDRVYSGYRELFGGFFGHREDTLIYDIFENYHEEEVSRKNQLMSICQDVLEYISDYRSAL
jgi:thymidylate kinase